ncbi:hypothetical protein Tco_0148960 [Tanacetum coccineum]
MHESRDPHALRGSLHVSGFHLESFYELLNGLSVPLLDIIDFDGIFAYFFCCIKYAKNAALRSFVPPVPPLGKFLRDPLGPLFRHRSSRC